MPKHNCFIPQKQFFSHLAISNQKYSTVYTRSVTTKNDFKIRTLMQWQSRFSPWVWTMWGVNSRSVLRHIREKKSSSCHPIFVCKESQLNFHIPHPRDVLSQHQFYHAYITYTYLDKLQFESATLYEEKQNVKQGLKWMYSISCGAVIGSQWVWRRVVPPA